VSDFHASITVYDFLSDIYIGLRVYDCRADIGPSRLVLEGQILATGEGESNPAKWLRDALLDVIETL